MSGLFDRTPTGRFKKGYAGRCAKFEDVVQIFTSIDVPPCVSVQPPSRSGIWPDTDASKCKFWEAASQSKS